MLDQGWYSWFAPLVAWGEALVGLGLIVGAFVGLAAFFGTLMNFNFMLAGSTSTNPVLFGLGIFLVLAWKVAGYWGLDRWLLPTLGTPWDPRLLREQPAIEGGTATIPGQLGPSRRYVRCHSASSLSCTRLREGPLPASRPAAYCRLKHA